MSVDFGQMIRRGLLSARPAAGVAGSLYFATDTGIKYRDNGTAWEPELHFHSALLDMTPDDHHDELHAAAHAAVGADPVTVESLATAATNPTYVLAADGSGGLEMRAEAAATGGVTEITALPTAETDDTKVLAPDGAGGVEWRAETGGTGGGAPTDAAYLVTGAHSGLSAEVVVGATPGGELGGTWAAPTVDAVHAGSAHADYVGAVAFLDHNARHQNGGGDTIRLDDLDQPEDNTDLNATTGHHGLLPKLDNVLTHFLNGQGGWTAPATTSGGGSVTEIADLPTAEMNTALVLAPDGAGGVVWRTETGGGGGSVGLVGLTHYNPGTQGTYTTTTGLVDMDATNLKVDFVAPASGNVLVRLTCQVYNSVANSGSLAWALREGSTTVAGQDGVATGEGSGNAAAVRTISRTFRVTGLTPGSSHTYKWAAIHGVNSWVNRWGGGNGGATMEVWAEGAGGSSVTDADYLVGTAHAGLSGEIVVGTTPGGELGGTWASPTVDATHAGSTHAAAQSAAEATAAAALSVHAAAADPHPGYLTAAEADAAYAPAAADYLVGTAQGGLSAEIVVGATPGGELGGTWAAPTVDASHAGSTHADAQAAAEATAAAALSVHAAAADPHSGYLTPTEGDAAYAGVGHSHGASGIDPTLLDAKGDMIAASAADTPARVPAGTAGQIFVADPSATAGVRWAERFEQAANGAFDAAINITEAVVVFETFDANELTAGATFRFEAWFTRVGTQSAAPTARIRIGTTTLTGNIAGSVTPVAANVAVPYKVEGLVTIVTAGSGGTARASLEMRIQYGAVTVTSTITPATATVAVDTTAANQRIELTFTSGHATNTYTVRHAYITRVA